MDRDMQRSQKDGITVKYIVPYMVLLLIVCFAVLGVDFRFGAADEVRYSILIPATPMFGLTAAAVLFCVAFQNLLPRSWREVIVFWRLRERLPGYRAFSRIALNDARINATRLAHAGGRPDLTPQAQNDLWYQWYRKYQDEPSVWRVSRLYLAFRDLSAFALVTSPIAIAAWLFEGRSGSSALVLAGFVASAYLVAMTVARNKATELVSNVLALKSSVGVSEPRVLMP